MWLYEGSYSGIGRPKKYIGKVDVKSELNKFDYIGIADTNESIYSKVLYSMCLKKTIKVIVLLKNRGKKTAVSLLYSTDINLDAQKLVKYYKLRFQIEFIFRDAKQYTGLTHVQSCKKEAIQTHINSSLTALNIIKLADLKQKNTRQKTVISISSWKRRMFNKHLMIKVFLNLGLSLKCKKVMQVYSTLGEYGCIAS